MKPYTVNAVRTTLYSIIQNIFTATFIEKYENNIYKYEHNMAETMYNESKKADCAIVQMSLCIDCPAMLDAAINKLTSKTICTIYMRYYVLSRYLEAQIQSSIIQLPESKGEFFQYLLTSYWQNALG